jgi:inhibitor of KinA
MVDFSLEPLAEDALLLRFGDGIDRATNACVHAAARVLRDAELPGITDIAPAYATLLVRFDPETWCSQTESPPFTRIVSQLHSLIGGVAGKSPLPSGEGARRAGEGSPPAWSHTHPEPSPLPLSRRERGSPTPPAGPNFVEIPVCYGDEYGLDLDTVAEHAGLSRDDVIARHAAAEYTVAMLGFAPGFPYLLGLDPSLQVPRRADPRTRVAAGSIAIGGAQAGIYPRELPGGWHLIGRTPRVLFDPAREPPCLLAPGDHVRFRMIEAGEFARLAERDA